MKWIALRTFLQVLRATLNIHSIFEPFLMMQHSDDIYIHFIIISHIFCSQVRKTVTVTHTDSGKEAIKLHIHLPRSFGLSNCCSWLGCRLCTRAVLGLLHICMSYLKESWSSTFGTIRKQIISHSCNLCIIWIWMWIRWTLREVNSLSGPVVKWKSIETGKEKFESTSSGDWGLFLLRKSQI